MFSEHLFSLDQEYLQACAVKESFLTIPGEHAVAVLVSGNVIFAVVPVRPAVSTLHVGVSAEANGKCLLEPGPTVASVPHCHVRVAWPEYFHGMSQAHQHSLTICFMSPAR